jgi:hypothetical protein
MSWRIAGKTVFEVIWFKEVSRRIASSNGYESVVAIEHLCGCPKLLCGLFLVRLSRHIRGTPRSFPPRRCCPLSAGPETLRPAFARCEELTSATLLRRAPRTLALVLPYVACLLPSVPVVLIRVHQRCTRRAVSAVDVANSPAHLSLGVSAPVCSRFGHLGGR